MKYRIIGKGPRCLATLQRAAGMIPLFAVLLCAFPDVSVTPIFDKVSYAPGDSIIVALSCKIPDRFHLYGNPLGPGIGKPLMIEVSESRGVEWHGGRKTPADRFRPPIGEWVWAYKHEATFFITGSITRDSAGVINDTIVMDMLICENSCIPVFKKIPIAITVTGEKIEQTSFYANPLLRKIFAIARDMEVAWKKPAHGVFAGAGVGIDLSGISQGAGYESEIIPDWDYEPLEGAIRYSLFLSVALAFFAGIILNLMPCVLPVLGVRILSFSQNAGSGKNVAVTRSLIFSAGMILVFMVLASFAALQGTKRRTSAYANEFFKGMITTVMATPCSGPLLGATLAWALLQPAPVIYLVFFSVGVGMAFPYVLLSSSSRLMKLIPKPGPWMEDFKHLMGFLLFAFAVHFMEGLPHEMILPTVGFCIILGFVVMAYTRFAPFGATATRSFFTAVIVLALTAAGGYLLFSRAHTAVPAGAEAFADGEWEPFSPMKLAEAHAKGRHVIIDFTASWCMNCQLNKAAVYHTGEAAGLIREKKIVAMKADLTREHRAAESLMHHLGSRSVPFLAIFPGDDPYHPIIMRDIVSKRKFIKTLRGLADL